MADSVTFLAENIRNLVTALTSCARTALRFREGAPSPSIYSIKQPLSQAAPFDTGKPVSSY